MKQYLNLAIRAAKKAGKLQMQFRDKPKRIKAKGIIDYVTEVDIASEKLICAMIRKKFPTHHLVTEENTCVSTSKNINKKYSWIIDPLDGTINYMHGLPLFCISIAFAIDNQVQAGVVYAPALGECFTAIKGKGAYMNNKHISVSKHTKLIKSLLVTGFAYNIHHADNTNLDNFARISLQSQAVRRLGSAAIDLAYIAAGRFEGFWELYLNPWDMAAGSLLVKEAGGNVTDFSGKTFNIYGKQLLATNGKIHHLLKQLIQ